MDANGILKLNKNVEDEVKDFILANKDDFVKKYKAYKKLFNSEELNYKKFINIIHKLQSLYTMILFYGEEFYEVAFYYIAKSAGVLKK